MSYALLADFGSTYTKLTAVDLDKEQIIGTSKAFTTVDTDINIGLKKGLEQLKKITGNIRYDTKLACSSAAGGLRMVTVGLVKELTAKASEMAALNAGAKVLKVYCYSLTEEDIEEIIRYKPEIILLAGGIDGGNQKVIIENAKMIAKSNIDAVVLIAGNKSATHQIKSIFDKYNQPYEITDNVMPDYNILNIEPARSKIRDIFLDRIIYGKGLDKIKENLDGILMPTPSAVLKAVSLLAYGTCKEKGLGELIAVDVGGATTDVYSIAKHQSYKGNTIIKGIPEPTYKRTVEGDLGLKYSIESLYDQLAFELKSKIDKELFLEYFNAIKCNPAILPDEATLKLEEVLTIGAIEEAVNRHVGVIKKEYTINGSVNVQIGKDLTEVKVIIGTGGPIINSHNPQYVLKGILYNQKDGNRLKPKDAMFLLDKKYILAAMGLLSSIYPDKALRILKKELVTVGL